MMIIQKKIVYDCTPRAWTLENTKIAPLLNPFQAAILVGKATVYF